MQWRNVLSAFLGLAVLVAPLVVVAPSVRADDDPGQNDSSPGEEDVTLDSPVIEGIIYKVGTIEGTQVLTVLAKDVTMAGTAIEAYVRDPALVAQIKNNTFCIGRFVRVAGIRTSPKTMDAQGIWVDPTTKCGTPPGVK